MFVSYFKCFKYTSLLVYLQWSYWYFFIGHSVPNHGSRASPVNNNLSKSNRSSPQGFAGSKCFEPPTPNSLPKPPSDWTPFQLAGKENLFGDVGILNFGEMIGSSPEKHTDVSQQLKLILNANA